MIIFFIKIMAQMATSQFCYNRTASQLEEMNLPDSPGTAAFSGSGSRSSKTFAFADCGYISSLKPLRFPPTGISRCSNI